MRELQSKHMELVEKSTYASVSRPMQRKHIIPQPIVSVRHPQAAYLEAVMSGPDMEVGCPPVDAHEEEEAAEKPAALARGVNTAAAHATSRKDIGLLFNRKFQLCFGLPFLLRLLGVSSAFMAGEGDVECARDSSSTRGLTSVAREQ